MAEKSEPYRYLPAVHTLAALIRKQNYAVRDDLLTAIVRRILTRYRQKIQTGTNLPRSRVQAQNAVMAMLQAEIDQLTGRRLRPVINATGIVLHTGLGRAPLGPAMLTQASSGIAGYVNLEFDLETGERGERLDLAEDLLTLMTGAESSAVVNNNAAAVLLALNSIADGREVIVSRGELIEIGGSFRLPEIIQKSGARMVEVGTTNRTHLPDYVRALNKNTGAILLVHPSNYRVQGFTARPEPAAIIKFAHQHRLPVMLDLGSGALCDLPSLGLPVEQTVAETIHQGYDLVTFSGDKLLGGPQAGLIVGKKRLIRRLRSNPLMRCVRCDKLTLALLVHTLQVYLKPGSPQLPTYALLTCDQATLRERAEEVIGQVTREVVKYFQIRIRETVTEAGSGSLPTENLPSMAIVLKPVNCSASALARHFRRLNPPVIGYSRKGYFCLDLKTVLPADLPPLSRAINQVGERLRESQ